MIRRQTILLSIIISLFVLGYSHDGKPWPPAAEGTCGEGAGGIGDTWEPGLGICLLDCHNPKDQLRLGDSSNDDNWWEWSYYGDGNPCVTGAFMGNECCFLCGDGQIDNEEECDPGSTIGPYVYNPSSDNTCACNDDCTCSESDSMEINTQIIPDYYNISNIYPNPFNPVTSITYGLPENTDILIKVYDMTGQQITTLVNTFQTAGYHIISWNASSYPSGVYLIRIDSGDFTQTQKVVLVK